MTVPQWPSVPKIIYEGVSDVVDVTWFFSILPFTESTVTYRNKEFGRTSAVAC